ncbi:MAG: SpoIIE family protein phosphatase [bacterium]|nr:SpoIIE family protein phosphatase [bacterium]
MDSLTPDVVSDELGRCKQRIGRLEAIVEASVLVNSTLDLRELAEHVIHIATRLIGAGRGSLFLVEPEDRTLRSLVAQGIEQTGLVLSIGEGIVGAVALSGEAVLLNDPYNDSRFDPSVDRATGYRTTSLLTVPVRDRDGVLVAVLQLLNHAEGRFSQQDVAFLAELGVPFAIALTTARMHVQIVERERLQEEMRLAAEIQQTLQPQELESVPGLSLETSFRPCLEVGGDYMDIIPTDDEDRWWLVVADISGKGVSAGIIASNVQAYLWSRRNDECPLEEVMASGNDLLYRLARGRKFATLVLVEWRPASRTMSWVSAGHPPIMLRRDGEIRQLGATGRPIGLLPDQTYRTGQETLEQDDLFVLYSDGVFEAGMGSPVGEFGLDRLERCLRGSGDGKTVSTRVEDALREHLDGTPLDDDVTIVYAGCER